MKRILLVLAVAIAAIASISCEKENEGKLTVNVTTSDATNITLDYFTLHGNVEWECDGKAAGEAGILVGTEPGVTYEKNLCVTDVTYLGTGTFSKDLSYNFKNIKGLSVISNSYYFSPGSTCYFRAFVRVNLGDRIEYEYGAEKSFTVPQK